MNKIIFIILIVVGISYGQNPIPDSLSAHRTVLTLHGDSITALRTDVNTNTSNVALKSNIASPTFTGTVTIPTLNISSAFQIDESPLTASMSELNILDGVTTTTAQLNYINTLTSDAQTQLGLKETKVNHDTLATGVNANADSITTHRSAINTNISNITSISSAQGSTIRDSIEADIRFISIPVLSPATDDLIPLLRFPENVTITSCWAGIVGGTSVDYNFGWSNDLSDIDGVTVSATYDVLFASDVTASSSVGTEEGGGFEYSTPDAGEWLVFTISDVVGTVSNVVVTITYTKR